MVNLLTAFKFPCVKPVLQIICNWVNGQDSWELSIFFFSLISLFLRRACPKLLKHKNITHKRYKHNTQYVARGVGRIRQWTHVRLDLLDTNPYNRTCVGCITSSLLRDCVARKSLSGSMSSLRASLMPPHFPFPLIPSPSSPHPLSSSPLLISLLLSSLAHTLLQ